MGFSPRQSTSGKACVTSQAIYGGVAFWHTIKRYADAKEVHEILKKFGKYPEEEEEKKGKPNGF